MEDLASTSEKPCIVIAIFTGKTVFRKRRTADVAAEDYYFEHGIVNVVTQIQRVAIKVGLAGIYAPISAAACSGKERQGNADSGNKGY